MVFGNACFSKISPHSWIMSLFFAFRTFYPVVPQNYICLVWMVSDLLIRMLSGTVNLRDGLFPFKWFCLGPVFAYEKLKLLTEDNKSDKKCFLYLLLFSFLLIFISTIGYTLGLFNFCWFFSIANVSLSYIWSCFELCLESEL